MTLKNYLKTASGSLGAHKSRSVLTVLGIVIGIASIILIMSVGKGAEELILRQLKGMGAETIVIRPGREPTGPQGFAETIFADSLKERDVEALKQKGNVPDLVAIAPAVIVPGGVSRGSETYGKSVIFGWTAEIMAEAMDILPERGSIFDEIDIRQRARVAIIGKNIVRELFSDVDPIGQYLTIRDQKFRVIGIYPSRGQVAFFNIDDVVLIPYTTARQDVLGIAHYHEIITRAKSTDAVGHTVLDIQRTLRDLHGITDPAKDDFFVVTQEGAVKQISTIVGTFTLFLSLVVAVALVVGGIGVMNIMLVSVTERTREIGLRKAVGATNVNILAQFLLEAILLTTAGGIIGITIGTSFSYIASIVISKVLGQEWQFIFPLAATFTALSVSAGVGLVFGLYPARQAAKKSPIEALRYE